MKGVSVTLIGIAISIGAAVTRKIIGVAIGIRRSRGIGIGIHITVAHPRIRSGAATTLSLSGSAAATSMEKARTTRKEEQNKHFLHRSPHVNFLEKGAIYTNMIVIDFLFFVNKYFYF